MPAERFASNRYTEYMFLEKQSPASKPGLLFLNEYFTTKQLFSIV
jgi:hypothetical protein